MRSWFLIEPILTPSLALAGEENHFRVYFDMAQAGTLPLESWTRDGRGFLDYRRGPGTWEALSEAPRERFREATESTVAAFRSNLK